MNVKYPLNEQAFFIHRMLYADYIYESNLIDQCSITLTCSILKIQIDSIKVKILQFRFIIHI